MKAAINKNTCMFCGMCGGLCPEIFRADSDRKTIAMDMEISEELMPTVSYAASICPTWSISVEEQPVVNMQ